MNNNVTWSVPWYLCDKTDVNLFKFIQEENCIKERKCLCVKCVIRISSALFLNLQSASGGSIKKKISITLPLPIASLYGPQYIWVNVNCFKPFDQNKFSPALQSWLSIRLSSTVSPQLNWILANDFSTVELVNPCLFKCEMKHIHYVIVYGHLAFEVIADIYSDSFFFCNRRCLGMLLDWRRCWVQCTRGLQSKSFGVWLGVETLKGLKRSDSHFVSEKEGRLWSK